MALHLTLLAMLVVAMLAVLVPLARARRGIGVSRGGATLGPAALHRLRLVEIDRDLDRGLLDPLNAEAARNEAARLLLRGAERDTSAARPSDESMRRAASRGRRVAALVALIVLPVFSVGLYALLGSPNLPSQPFNQRLSLDPAKSDIYALIGQVEAHLAAHPDDGRGYEVIAPVYMQLGRYDDAVRARSKVLSLLGETADRQAGLAEAEVEAAAGVVTEEASRAIARALALDPKQPEARFLQAIGYEQDGKREQAIAALKALLADSPADARWRPAVEARLARLTGGSPSPAVAKNPAIRAMVEGLAARLKASGGSVQEWARLVRSYGVLGEPDKARAALAAARAAHPDAASLATLAAVARTAGIEAKP